ncbi:MAG: 4Fe-4S binding protein [Thermodesulfovibrionales bacterium]|nr:4Fe-4S binding protein [Thermodesulfovibrionales bacterium]
MQADTNTKKSFFVRYRLLIMLLGIAVFLPPLSLLFQFTQDSNFCGTWCPRMFFSWRSGTTAGEFLLGFLRSYMGVALVLGVLASTFFLGRYWCSHLCPVGGSMEAASRLVPRRLKINYSGIPAPPFRYGYLAVYLIAPALGIGSLCCNYCNFATIPRLFGASFSQADMAYFLRNAGLINLGLVAVMGFFAKGGRAYCNLLCPIGALDALSNRLGIRVGKRLGVSGSKCNGCGACAKVCPTWSIDVGEKAEIDQLSCMPCRLCEEACPKEAIAYGKINA